MNVAILLSGGTGTRLGEQIPKQYIEVMNRPLIAYCFDALSMSSKIDAICIVAAADWHEYIKEKCGTDKTIIFAEPGRNRQESIYNGLKMIEKSFENVHSVFIDDAARPYLTENMIDDYYDALEGYDGVLPVLPMKDTVYFSQDGTKVDQLLKRECIYAGQAPEIFVFDKYLQANMDLLPDRILNINGSTEPAIMASMNIHMVPGEEKNFKITTRADLDRFSSEIMHR